MKDKNIYNVIIVGAGPIGLACGIEAVRNGLSYKIIEKGCLVNSIYHYPTNMVFFSTSDRLEIGEVPFISHGVKPTRTEALEYYRRVKDSWNLNVNTYESVINVRKTDNEFNLETTKGEYVSKNIIVATGFYDFPNLMGIKGEELPKVMHYYGEPHPYAYHDVLVIGGGNSAVDVALETYRRGSNVTMVIRKDKIEEGVKYWVRPDIENRIKEGEIKAYFHSEVLEISENSVMIKTPDKILNIENDFVFAMTGYQPDFKLLKMIGIELKGDKLKEPVYDKENFETNIEGIFLAGVVCGGMDTGKWFIENARIHAPKIFEYLKSKT